MKRLLSLTLADMRFQFKYGFYYVYLFVSLLYTLIISLLPHAWRESARILTVFSDPAALGLFFMGAIMLYEKGENILPSLAVSPVRTGEYILAKLLSIGFVSVLSGTLISLASGGTVNPFFFCGLFLGSCLFTLVGILFGSRTKTINQFLIITVPAEIVIFVPAILYYFGYQPFVFQFHPGVLVIRLLGGASGASLPVLAFLAAWVALVFFPVRRTAGKMFRSEGTEVMQ